MADCVAEQVHYRILKSLQHAVRPHAGSIHPVCNLLVLGAGQIPNHLAKAFAQAFGWHHTRSPYGALVLFGHALHVPIAALLQKARHSRLAGQGTDVLFSQL
jgi:hypothetical protein